MADRLVELGPGARKLVRSLGLPLPLPQPLRRDLTPWRRAELKDEPVVVRAAALASVLA